MQIVRNVCVWIIMKEPRPIGLCFYKFKKIIKNKDVVFMMIARALETIWICI